MVEEEVVVSLSLLGELEIAQKRILQRISALEQFLLLPHQHQHKYQRQRQHQQDSASTDTESRLSALLRDGGVGDFCFKKVPFDYYDRSIDARREILSAPTIHHLCKSIVMVNTQARASVNDCSDRNNSKYYIVVIQYTARLNAENVKSFLYSLNNGKIPKKKFNMRLAPEEESLKLTGYEHNGVTCVGMKTDIPVQHLSGTTKFTCMSSLIMYSFIQKGLDY